jgi:hypothetical protein
VTITWKSTWGEFKRELTEAIGSVDRLRGRGHHYSVRKVTPPAFLVDLPEEMLPHGAYGDGMQQWRVPFSVVVGAVLAESSEDELAEFVDLKGPRSVIRAVEDRIYTAADTVTVVRVEPAVMTFSGVQYLGALFESDVAVGKRL